MGRSDKARFAKLALADEERLTAGLTHHRAPAWSRDGRLLAFAVGGERDGAFVLTDRRGRVARTFEGPAHGAPAFSPDGATAFARRFGLSREIWLSPGGDAPPVRLLGGDGYAYFDPTFSPDGKTLACAIADEARPDRSRLLLVRVATGERLEPPSEPHRADARPCFTPIGDELVFEGRAADGDRALYALHLVRHELTRLTSTDERATCPSAIDPGLIVYERATQGGTSSLALLDRKRERSHAIAEDDVVRAEPACFVDDEGKVKIAYVVLAPPRIPGGLPRFDLFTARLRGVNGAREEAAEAAVAS